MRRQLIIASDHAGFELKEEAKSFLTTLDIDVTDMGTDSTTPVDYPDFGGKAAHGVSSGAFPMGILICGSGIGMSIVANKFPGVRAALCLDEWTAEMCRRHNNANMLVLAGRKTTTQQMKQIIRTWLSTEFEGKRHQQRLDKIKQIEEKYQKGTDTCLS
ncbi:MAG: ribose 5-phosphate isomerase B [Syntrophobacterales bacterium]|jgi:ribose 5-phosphate isomerase B|nr:ribose 5-phosphate isomerase B [Syntrophobacterales bacterium]